jgi:protein-disulfide isomerase
VKLVHKHLPLSIHPDARNAALAAEAARQQGRFWEMHELLFHNVGSLDRAGLSEHARKLGLDLNRFEAGMDGEETAERIDRDLEDARGLKIARTPTILVNGIELPNYRLETLREAIRRSLASESNSPGG